MKNNTVIHGDSLKVLSTFEENYFDTVITDPPYGLTTITKRFSSKTAAPAQYGTDGAFARLSKGFMGQEWDGTGIELNVDLWMEVLRVSKPGALLFSFGGTRTSHRIACAIEDAGWILKDTMMWIYYQGMPHGYNIGKGIDKKFGAEDEAIAFDGHHTALKPAYEPIIVAQKPLDGTNVNNALAWGVGCYNINEARIGEQKRWPSNIVMGCYCEDENNHDYNCPITILNRQAGKKKGSGKTYDYTGQKEYAVQGFLPNIKPSSPSNRGDSGGVERIFYCAKASKAERNAGLDTLKPVQKIYNGKSAESSREIKDVEARFTTQPQQNFHPTVKPLKLMEYLCALSKTPTGGIVLDPFAGSGTTLRAAKNMGREYVGIEAEEQYIPIIEGRLKDDS